MDVRLEITGEDDRELVDRLSRDLLGAIRRDVDGDARLDSRPGAAGDRADIITLGAILMAVVTSGGLGKLLEVVNAWISRKPHLAYKIKRADGAELTIDAEFCSAKDMQEQTAICREFMKV